VTNSDAAAWAYTPFDDGQFQYPENGDVWVDVKYSPNLQLAPGQFGFSTMLHEIGHAIGFDHPFNDGYSGEPVINPAYDNDQWTVMSYTPQLATLAYASTPQVLDILAIQYIYGANMNTRTGNDTYSFSASVEVNRSIWDAGGNDTINLSNQTTSSYITLLEGTYSEFCRHAYNGTPTSSLLGIAYGVTIENANGGSAGDEIIGNDVANKLNGNGGGDDITANGGNDALDGGTGADTLRGGTGNDSYVLDNAGDVVVEDGADSNDSVKSSVIVGLINGIENYTYTGALAWTLTVADGADNTLSGGSGSDKLNSADGNDKLSGNGGNDQLTGGLGNDSLDGGTGNDKMKGGGGDDTYTVDAAGDTIDEEGNGDTKDTVRSTVTVNLTTLGAGAIENAILLGAVAINATGNGSNNELTGNSAANQLNGLGGADKMSGENGADTYTVDNLGDQVIETTGGTAGGIDLVKSSVTFTLGNNVENLTLTGSGKADAFGNNLNNILIGNNGANRLDGGDGNDTMTGGQGDDTYVVKTAGDIVNELVLNSANGGVDTVESAITYSLATRTNIENLTLTGTAKINGTGNALGNTILGNTNDNILDGGAGGDTLKGRAGNDTYVLDSLADLVDEEGNTDKADLVKTSARITAAFAEVENYTYTGTLAWTFTGNELDNKIVGGSGNDTLAGLGGNDWLDGGLGNDKMKGGAGDDTYTIGSVGDVIDEEGNADLKDLVRSTITVNLLTLAGGAIENAFLIGTAAINATGNDGANELTGNAAANVLDGRGGIDVMDGGKGADTYIVDNALDQVIESIGAAAGGGLDLVKAGVTYSLLALGNVENLTLTGTGDFNATGNGLNNVLIGNKGANVLNGGGGSDTMTGGEGDDTYVVNSTGDIVNETVLNSLNGGHDTVQSGVTFTLATRTNIEDLELTGSAINGTGNALNNHITGNSNNNTLDGGSGSDTLVGAGGNDTLLGNIGNDILNGGDGNDKMTGGAGNDTFDFNLVAELGDADTITDFIKGSDKLDISDLLTGYTGIFDDYVSFTYSGTTTNVFVDADGLGAGLTTMSLASLLNVHLTDTDTASFVLPPVV
jgi:serralysin